MEQFFLSAVEWLSVSRFWLMPILVIIVLALLAREIRMAFIGILDEMTHASPHTGATQGKDPCFAPDGATQGKKGEE